MTADDIVVSGVGVVSPAGIGADATWRGLLAGRSTTSDTPELAGLDVDFCSRVPAFDPADRGLDPRLTWRLDPFCVFALIAADEAVRDAELDTGEWDPQRVAVVVGCGGTSTHRMVTEVGHLVEGRPQKVSPVALPRSLPNMVAGEIGLRLGVHGPNLAVSTACASGTTALGVARDLLRSGSCDLAVAGGADSACTAMASVAFSRMGALSRRAHDPGGASRPFDRDRDGFVLGEGAGILVLERAGHARARGRRPRGRLAGYGASCDAYHVTAPHPEGRGAAEAMRAALRDAGLTPGDIDHVNAHGTATVRNDMAEARALHQVFRRPPPVTAAKGVLGHAVGGAGAIEAACTVLTLEHQTIPPTANLDTPDPAVELDVVHKAPRGARMAAALSNSFGFGGQNAVLVLTAP